MPTTRHIQNPRTETAVFLDIPLQRAPGPTSVLSRAASKRTRHIYLTCSPRSESHTRERRDRTRPRQQNCRWPLLATRNMEHILSLTTTTIQEEKRSNVASALMLRLQYQPTANSGSPSPPTGSGSDSAISRRHAVHPQKLLSSMLGRPGCIPAVVTLGHRASTSLRRYIASLPPSLLRGVPSYCGGLNQPNEVEYHPCRCTSRKSSPVFKQPHPPDGSLFTLMGQIQVHGNQNQRMCKVGIQGSDARLSLNSIINTYKPAASFEQRPVKPPRCSALEWAVSPLPPLRCRHTNTHKPQSPCSPHSPSTQENTQQ
ncbi:hypothetical protein LZ30DRAFT_15866 [Colletotrichum cereale]|nr:hypothetical protein LZ30DRAFT_15866 [Colletotrichum cereale]